MDIEYFDKLWRESKTDSSALTNFWDNRAAEFNKLHESLENQARLEQLISFWREQNILSPNAEVLDIGCGPGYISFELAPLVKQVEAVDISPKMIEYSQKRQLEDEIKNTSFRVLDWAEADLDCLGWRKKFDFVFAARCPGLNSREALEKMIQASNNFCFISSFAKMKSSLKSELNKNIYGHSKSLSSVENTIYCAFNILWLMGYYPQLSFYDTGWKKEYSLEEAISTNTKYYEMHGGLSEEQNKTLLSTLKQNAKEGLVEEFVEVKVAWLTWKV